AHGVRLRSARRAEPPRDPEAAVLVRAVGRRDRAPAAHAAADCVEAPARAARGRVRGGHGGRAAPPLPLATRAASGSGGLAGSVPALLVRAPGCPRTPPRPHGSTCCHEEENPTVNDNPRSAKARTKETDR